MDIHTPAKTDTVAATKDTTNSKADTAKKTETVAPQSKGLSIAFKEVTVFIPNITILTKGKANPIKPNGASYELTGGELNNNKLIITGGGTIQKISQQYQTIVVVNSDMGMLPLQTLSYFSKWQPLKSTGKSYEVTGLDPKKLEYEDADASEIRAAVTKAIRAKHINKHNADKWTKSVHNARNVKQAPLSVVLHTVIWKIEGKDASGKAYQKQVRMDMAL
jgi:hypothetical protein